jgi:hypothetical protein
MCIYADTRLMFAKYLGTPLINKATFFGHRILSWFLAFKKFYDKKKYFDFGMKKNDFSRKKGVV